MFFILTVVCFTSLLDPFLALDSMVLIKGFLFLEVPAQMFCLDPVFLPIKIQIMPLMDVSVSPPPSLADLFSLSEAASSGLRAGKTS